MCTIVINCEDSCNRLLLGFANTTRDSSAATTYKLWCKLNGENEVGDSGAVVLNCELEELLGWYCLGICNEEVSLARYLNEPGALEEERWETLHWEEPEKETIPCWWIVNKDDPDKKKPPTLLARSIALVRIELCHNRVALTSKLRKEHDRREANNSTAVDILRKNQGLWDSVGGPPPEELKRPSGANMERAQECSDALQHMYAVDDRDGYPEFAQEISKAVSMLSSVEWEDIRKEKFFLTPRALYDELARTADSLNSRMAAEDTRRHQWLAAAEASQSTSLSGKRPKMGSA